jgi:hypothetical protein
MHGAPKASANSSSVVNGEYVVRFDSSDLSIAHIDCRLPVKGEAKMSAFRTENLDNGWATFVRHLTLKTPDGRVVQFVRTAEQK